MTDRAQDLMDITAAMFLSKCKKPGSKCPMLKQVFLDVSQSHCRPSCSSEDGVGPCFTTSSELYHFGSDRVVLPQEMLAMLGYVQPVQLPDSVQPQDLKRMLGGGMSLPCIGAILIALHVMRTASPTSPESVDSVDASVFASADLGQCQ